MQQPGSKNGLSQLTLSFFSLLLLIAVVAYISFAGSTGQIKGKVFTYETDSTGYRIESPLIGATIQVIGTNLGAVADANGDYLIRNLKPGTYSLKITGSGYSDVTVTNVEVVADRTTEISQKMTESMIGMLDSLIVDQEHDVIEKGNVEGKAIGSAKGIKHKPASSVNDVLSSQAGVQTNPNGQVYLRGGKKSEVGYILDGSPIMDCLGGGANRYSQTPIPGTESYSSIAENDFHRAKQDPLSTFSIDVDAASYSNVRRFITEGTLPPSEAVRTEELINYFDYDYPNPTGEHPFSITTEVGPCPWEPSHQLVHVGIQGRRMENHSIPANNLVFLIDVSGSMGSPDRLPLVQQSFRLLVKELRSIDRVAIVVYAGSSGLVLESTPGNQKEVILQAIDRLSAGGSTAGGAGIQLAYKIASQHFMANGNNRVILATDGDFNVGVSSESDLQKLIEEKRETGVFLTVLGFGRGNLKDSRMEVLADKGNGNYAYIDNLLEGKKALVTEMSGTLLTIAKDVKIQIEFNPSRVEAYRLVGYENRILAPEDFNNDKKDAGELGAGHSVTALYEIVPTGGVWSSGVDPLRYQTVRNVSSVMPPHPDMKKEHDDEILTVKFRYKQPKGTTSILIVKHLRGHTGMNQRLSDNFQFSAAVAQFGMLLSRSEHRGSASWEEVISLAKSSLGRDEEGYRHEFVRLAENCQLMSRGME